MTREEVTPELVVRAYCLGAFPMADGRDGAVRWYRPDPRAILPLDGGFHVPRSLARRVRSGRFHVTRDQAFEQVIRACAAPRPKHPDTWINEDILRVYLRLNALGIAHSIEAWDAPPPRGQLVGGLYGVALGGAFFGESMFSRATDASKVCLVHLVKHLRTRGYTLLDTQFVNEHLVQFGAQEIPAAEYMQRLDAALALEASWVE